MIEQLCALVLLILLLVIGTRKFKRVTIIRLLPWFQLLATLYPIYLGILQLVVALSQIIKSITPV